MKKEFQVIGWREWIGLPDLNVKKIKVKVDSGARTSSLHAFNVNIFKKGKHQYVNFFIHPEQKTNYVKLVCEAKVLEFRKVKSSNGQTELRPVIETNIRLMDQIWSVELTLTNRDEMGFRMLLGREAIRKRFLIDTGKSFYDKSFSKKKVKKKIIKKD